MFQKKGDASAASIEDLKVALSAMTGERDGYKQAYETLNAEIGQLRANAGRPPSLPAAPKGEIYTDVFHYDGLWTDPQIIHNHDFMRDPRYVAAFQAGEDSLGLDHKMFWRLHVALWCASQASKLRGDFVECGVWRGFLSTAIMTYLNWAEMPHRFFLFDTFDGMVPDYLSDAERANAEKIDHLNRHYRGNFEFVTQHFAKFPRVEIVKGPVPDTLRTAGIEAVAFLSLDMNCAAPEIAAAEHFWPMMPAGAMILLDDYGFVSYEEQKQAFDDFAKRHGSNILALPTGQGLIVKSGVSMTDAVETASAEFASLRDESIQLRAERDGYKGAYEILNSEIGTMRMVAAPMLRQQLDVEAAKGKPSIFVVTLPKSGTVHIGHTLRQSLGYDFTSTLVTSTYPKNVVWQTMAADFQRGAMVSVSHMQPDEANLHVLKRVGIRKIVVHVRDPRAALLSWFHFRATIHDSTVALPERAVELALPMEEQIDAYIDGFYTDTIAWLTGWLAVDPDEFDILWLRHEDMIVDEAAYFSAIFDFHGLQGTDLVPLAREANVHFRTGDNSDWRSALTPSQIERVNKLLPEQLAARFDWEY